MAYTWSLSLYPTNQHPDRGAFIAGTSDTLDGARDHLVHALVAHTSIPDQETVRVAVQTCSDWTDFDEYAITCRIEEN